MAALTNFRRLREESWTYHKLPMATGLTAFKGALAVVTAAGKVAPATAATGLTVIGTFDENFANATGSDQLVRVRLKRELRLIYFKNDGTNPVTTVGTICYAIDDQTVSSLATGRSAVGTVWAVDNNLGVAVEMT